MISLDLDLLYLNRYFNIGVDKLQQYRNKSITEIMEIEAESGNRAAADFLTQITSDPTKLVKAFQLINPKNRYLILINMNKDDLTKFIGMLEPEQLVLGLSIFTQEGLLKLMLELPTETLSKLVMKNMDTEKFLQIIPEDFLDEFLTSDKIDKDLIMKSLEEVDEAQMQKMMENMTGQPCYDDKKSIMKNLASMGDRKFMESILSFEREGKEQIIYGILNKRPDLMQEFNPEAIVFPFSKMEKGEILKALSELETKELMPMFEDLQQDVLALIATQIDPKVFAKVLSSEFIDVIAECGIDF